MRSERCESCSVASAEPHAALGMPGVNICTCILLLYPGWNPESEESSSLLQTAVSVLQSSYLDSTSQDGFLYSQAILVENDVFLREVRAGK